MSSILTVVSKDGTLHVGWVDAKTGEPVDDKDVHGKYENLKATMSMTACTSLVGSQLIGRVGGLEFEAEPCKSPTRLRHVASSTAMAVPCIAGWLMTLDQ